MKLRMKEVYKKLTTESDFIQMMNFYNKQLLNFNSKKQRSPNSEFFYLKTGFILTLKLSNRI